MSHEYHQLSGIQKIALEQFSWMEITPEELIQTLSGAISIRVSDKTIEAKNDTHPDEGNVKFTKRHIENALERKRKGEVSSESISKWARLILAISKYELDMNCEDDIAEWLHLLAFDVPASEP